MKRITQAICLYRKQKKIDGPLFLGMDTHALSVSAFASALEVLRDPGDLYRDLAREFGEPVYDRVEAQATPAQKERLAKLSGNQVKLTELAAGTRPVRSPAKTNGNPHA